MHTCHAHVPWVCSAGKDVILSNDNLRDTGDAIALTFVQTISLSQEDIFGLLPDFPIGVPLPPRSIRARPPAA